ncbi:SGNH/GDSL hydrolase family protein [Micromonospora sp. NPDC049048]|uniref:SGNH/GDSL hydrolase family protein n=1 Tax=Micromonospora sp. NPDC049048 TaxID=3364263 RepID=UPI00371518DD
MPATGPGAYGSGDLGDWTAGSKAISAPSRIDEADVWLLGDSLTVAGWNDFAVDIHASHGLVTATNGWSGRPTAPTVDVLADWVATYGPPRVLVMASGTNDIFGPATQGPPHLAAQIDRVMQIVGPSVPVVWVEVHIARWLKADYIQYADQRNSGWVNGILWEAAGRHDNLSVSIWERYLSAKPSRVPAYLSDGVHTNTTGMNARNELLRQEVVRRLGL